MKWCFVVMLIGLQIVSNGAINYCGSRMCGHTNEHTFCRYPPGPGPACTGYMQAPLSTEDKARILARLNRRRSDIALGLNDWPPAGDMLKLRWVEELSREAQVWADQCSPPGHPEKHDTCRDLYSVTVGQCVASIVGEAPGLRPETMVDIWYMQRISYTGNFTFYTTTSNNYYGDFVQMIWSRAYMVGCGRSRFMAQWRGRVRSVERLVCNFAPRGPIPSRALWTPGAPATMCPSRSHPDSEVPGLCTHISEYDINGSQGIDKSLTPEEHLLLHTILDIESNKTLDYMGSLDEHYLRRLAISTIGNDFITEPNYNNFVYKREVIEDIGMEENSEKNKVKAEITARSLIISVTQIKNATKRKLYIVGRPKSYNLADLEDETTPVIIKNDLVEDSTDKKDLYVDLEYVEFEDNNDFTTTELITETSNSDTNEDLVLKSQQNMTTESNNTKSYMPHNTFWNTSIMFNVSNLSLTSTENDTDLDDYLSDPETFRQLQEALERMENSLSIPMTTVGKVRREIRNLEENGHFPKKKINNLSPEELLELERNRTRERGPMLSMVMKYIPYLQPYEKTILGEEGSNGARRIMPSIILLLVLCM